MIVETWIFVKRKVARCGQWGKILGTLMLLSVVMNWLMSYSVEMDDRDPNDLAVMEPEPSLFIKRGKLQINEKLILAYTTFNHKADWGADFSACFGKCSISTNKSDLPVSDAVLFDFLSASRWKGKGRNAFPARGPTLQDQIRAFAILESPRVLQAHRIVSSDVFNNEFNWSISYRLDSDVPLTARTFVPLRGANQRTKLPSFTSIRNKKLVTGMISRCFTDSQREEYVARLQKALPVDVSIYGDCGSRTCNQSTDCYASLGQEYKFYLAFESALCTDYVTEKFFESMRNGMVPVVLGHADYAKVAPAHSYIDVRNFESPETLAKYLLYLDTHPTEYLEYFDWMKSWTLPSAEEQNRNFWCGLCEKLHGQISRKWYVYPGNWFQYNDTAISQCVRPPVQPFKKSMTFTEFLVVMMWIITALVLVIVGIKKWNGIEFNMRRQ